jgi:hypothetical protein
MNRATIYSGRFSEKWCDCRKKRGKDEGKEKDKK